MSRPPGVRTRVPTPPATTRSVAGRTVDGRRVAVSAMCSWCSFRWLTRRPAAHPEADRDQDNLEPRLPGGAERPGAPPPRVRVSRARAVDRPPATAPFYQRGRAASCDRASGLDAAGRITPMFAATRPRAAIADTAIGRTQDRGMPRTRRLGRLTRSIAALPSATWSVYAHARIEPPWRSGSRRCRHRAAASDARVEPASAMRLVLHRLALVLHLVLSRTSIDRRTISSLVHAHSVPWPPGRLAVSRAG